MLSCHKITSLNEQTLLLLMLSSSMFLRVVHTYLKMMPHLQFEVFKATSPNCGGAKKPFRFGSAVAPGIPVRPGHPPNSLAGLVERAGRMIFHLTLNPRRTSYYRCH